MGLFGKKESKKNPQCGCVTDGNAQNAAAVEAHKAEGASVKVLGGGCAKCNALSAATKAALAQFGMDTAIDHVTDFAQIATYGVMSTPALVVDGHVLVYGKVLKTEEIVTLLRNVRG
ncbi:MAG: thioredoxin family protein [Candidatus Limiplasma sp.]|nr:thioredoxin family protein [Candidatus Limiplasma sp.]